MLGHPGLTAWVGIAKIAQVRADDLVLVPSAAGAVGSVAAHGRAVSCGSISTYNEIGGYPFRNLQLVAGKRLTLRGFMEAPRAFLSLFGHANLGKALVRLPES